MRHLRGNSQKPVLQIEGGLWRCHDRFYIVAYGATPLLAYNAWRSRESRRTRISRHGLWNKQSVMDWYRRGCPTIRSYIYGKQIVSYDVATDQLVLRG